ncbi:hypothetical protein H4R24_000087 [Coemansia sp. RSA 988]|nr:hypothetical protein H4R24_000087 [Coemansia sp. RSA 988]
MRALKFQRLDILRIEIVSKFPDNNDNLYEITNSIMHDVGFDSAVAFIMDVQRIKIMPAMANWVNLTHLAINPELLTELELDLISMMPRLVYLKIKALDIGGRVSGEAAHKHFTDLQKKYATPLYTSKITVVVLEFGGEMSEELDLMAIELFRQYLPSLIHAHVEHITEE